MVWTRSLCTLCLLSLNLCLDYSMSTISLQAYWVALGGNEKWVGFVFGSYDALTIIISPIAGIIVGRFKYTSFRHLFIYAILLNLSGNVLYSIGGCYDNWVFLLFGRLIAGSGAAFLPLIMAYVSVCVAKIDQKIVVGYIKYSAALARITGPIIASILVLTPDNVQFGTSNNKLQELFNVYTLPGWIAVGFNILTLILTLLYVNNPEIVDEIDASTTKKMIYNEQNNKIETKNKRYDMIKFIFKTFLPIYIIGLIVTFIYWMCIANGFIISAAFYHLIHSTKDLWKIYISGLGGFIIAICIFIIFKQKIKPIWFLWMATILLFAGLIVFLFDNDWLYYTAVGIATLGYGFMIPSINIINNLLIKKNHQIVSDYRALIVSILSVFQAVGRFLGPSTFTWIVSIQNGNDCDIENYIVNGCSIKYYRLLLSISFAVCGVTTCIGMIILHRNFILTKKRLLTMN